jgi:uncharacterized membrane protein
MNGGGQNMGRVSWWSVFAWVVVAHLICGIGLAVSLYSEDAGYTITMLGVFGSFFVVVPGVQIWRERRGNSAQAPA